MFDEKYGERLPGSNLEKEKRGEYADLWEQADMMNGAPEFAGDDPYNPKSYDQIEGVVSYDEQGRPLDAEGNVISTNETVQAANADRYETKRSVERGYGGAEKLTSYGLDTAAKMYGLEPVLKVVAETDETGRDAYNPMGSIYSRLVPNPDERKHLYHEIQRESVYDDADDEAPNGASREKLGFDEDTGEFFATNEYSVGDAFNVTSADELAARETNMAVHQMKILLQALENDMRFEGLRQRAANEGKDIISYITSGEVNPTLSNFFDGLDAASGGVEEVLDTLAEQEAEKDLKEVQEKQAEGQELSEQDAEKMRNAQNELNDANVNIGDSTRLDNAINPEMLK